MCLLGRIRYVACDTFFSSALRLSVCLSSLSLSLWHGIAGQGRAGQAVHGGAGRDSEKYQVWAKVIPLFMPPEFGTVSRTV